MRKQILITVVLVGLVIAGLGFVKYLQISKAISEHSNFTPPPEAVTSIIVTEQEWDQTLNAVGSLAPVQGATLSSEESGTIAVVAVESGANVKKGDPLIELDTSVEKANLSEALAKKDWAEKKFKRIQTLRKTNAVSQEEMDDAESEYRQAAAVVASIESLIAKKKIVAPFDGRTGIRLVNVGQFVAPGTPLIPLYTVDPIYLNFSLPQQVLGLVSAGQEIKLTTDAFPGEVFAGTISTVNPQVEVASRSVTVQALIPNSDQRLKPGMFASVRVILPKKEKVIAIPSTSISYAPYGDTVYVIEKMKGPNGAEYNGVRQQVVKTGTKHGDLVSVTSGLKVGEEIVTSGLFKLRPNVAVAVNNSITPGNDPSPNPSDT